MRVYQENLELKEHIDTAKLANPDFKKFTIQLQMLKELESKMEDAIHQRKTMQKRFDTLSMWKGMSSE